MTPDTMIVSGRRYDRKDNFARRLNSLGWNLIVRMLFGYLIEDINCGFKLLRRDLLNHIHMQSDGAMIDTEMLAGTRARGYPIVEVRVSHFPRTTGQPTGANLMVIGRAFRDLFQVPPEVVAGIERGKAFPVIIKIKVASCAYERRGRPRVDSRQKVTGGGAHQSLVASRFRLPSAVKNFFSLASMFFFKAKGSNPTCSARSFAFIASGISGLASRR